MLSTGSPLAPESFDFVYEAIKPDLHLASISGGTDICGCFVGGNPLSPVWRGEIQGPMLGMAVDVFDDRGNSVTREKGELVCTKPFPSMPVMFWNDPGDKRYRRAYFERFPDVWTQGDYCELTEHDGVSHIEETDKADPGIKNLQQYILPSVTLAAYRCTKRRVMPFWPMSSGSGDTTSNSKPCPQNSRSLTWTDPV
jgi:hypothetical protein